MKYDRDLDFRVHLAYDSDVPNEATKAQLIKKHLKPHILQHVKHFEKMLEDFMKLTLEDLKDVFDERAN